MRLLLDTHVLLWALSNSPRLPQVFAEAITEPSNLKYVSSISVAEIEIKRSIGKLVAPPTLTGALTGAGFDELPFTAEHARTLSTLPLHHKDPFDRMLVAQALLEDLTFLSCDAHCVQYGCQTLDWS